MYLNTISLHYLSLCLLIQALAEEGKKVDGKAKHVEDDLHILDFQPDRYRAYIYI